MAGLLGVLLLPVRPSAAVARLEGRPQAALFTLAAPLLLGAFLVSRGCGAGDALAASGALLVAVCGMGLLGAAACQPAAFLAGGAARGFRRLPACLAAAGWTPILMTLLLGAARLLGLGGAAALAASLVLLVWGVALGVSLVGAGGAEPGRGLVASCLGLAGALAGLWLALSAGEARLVVVVPAPVAAEGFERGDLLLVRRQERADPGDVVLLRTPGSAEVVLARVDAAGRALPMGDPRGESRNRDVAGRVFFQFGSRGAEPVGNAGQRP